MTKEIIIEKITPVLEAAGCFLVDVTLSSDNDVEVVIEKEEGSVDWDDCALIDKSFHELFNQDEEDYSLTVSSAGLDRPFKVFRQFKKGGRRLIATLSVATEDSVTLSYTALEAEEGKKKKVRVDHEDVFPLSEINSVTPYIEFK